MALTKAYFVCLRVWLIYELGPWEKDGLLTVTRNFKTEEDVI